MNATYTASFNHRPLVPQLQVPLDRRVQPLGCPQPCKSSKQVPSLQAVCLHCWRWKTMLASANKRSFEIIKPFPAFPGALNLSWLSWLLWLSKPLYMAVVTVFYLSKIEPGIKYKELVLGWIFLAPVTKAEVVKTVTNLLRRPSWAWDSSSHNYLSFRDWSRL